MKTRILLFLLCIGMFNSAYALLSTPNLVAPSNGSTNQNINVQLDWDAVTGITGYEVLYGTSATFVGAQLAYVAPSNFTTSNLLFGSTYYWKVRAIKNTAPADSSAWSSTRFFTTMSSYLNVSPSNGSINQPINVLLDWSSVLGIVGFNYQIDTIASFSSPNLIAGATTANSQVSTGNLLFGTTYYWRTRAFSATDTTAWQQTWSFTTMSSYTNVSPSNGSINQPINVLLDWSSVLGIVGFNYQIDTIASFSSPNLIAGATTANSQVSTGNLLFGTTYYWRTRAFSATDTTAWQQTWSFTTMSTYTNVSPSNGSVNQSINVLLDWSAVLGIVGFNYQIDTIASFSSPNLVAGATSGNSQVSTGNLLFGTTYYWRTRAFSATDTTAWQQTWSFTTMSTYTNVSPNNGSINQPINVLLDWSSVNGIIGFNYQYDTDASFSSPNLVAGATSGNSQVSIGNLLYGTTYYWRTRAFSASDTTAWQQAWSFTTNYQMTVAPVLIAPSNGATNLAISGIQLQIGSIANANDYQYQISDNSNFSNAVIYNNVSLTQTLATLNPSTTYNWRARGRNSAGNSPWASPFSFTTLSGAPPAPINVSPMNAAVNINWTGTNISWSQVAGATGYVLVFDDDINFASPVTINTSDNFYSTGILNPNTTYYWHVQSTNGSGNSAFSGVWSFTTGSIPAPLLSSPANNSTGAATSGIVLTWLPVTGATSYYVEYADNAAFTGALGNTVTSTTIALPSLSNNQIYYWHVKANYSTFSSVNSNTFNFTTVSATILQAPILISPANMAISIPVVGTSLTWQNVVGALSYEWELSTDAAFTTPLNGNTLSTTTLLSALTNNATYYWHVRSVDADTVSAWSAAFSFTTDVLSGVSNLANNETSCFVANNQLSIFIDQYNSGALCEIYNAAGQLIKQQTISNLHTLVAINDLSSGIYIVRISNATTIKNFKVMIH